MAARKPQTRYVVEIDGQLRRLLSTRERASGDIFVTTHIGGLLRIQKGGGTKSIKESRHSIHVSPRSDTSTVHGVTELEDGTRIERHLSTTAVRDGRVQPIYARSVINPAELPILQLPAKGTVVKLPTYDLRFWTMYYAFWFSRREIGEINPMDGPFSFAIRAYRKFKLYIPICFVPIPSQPTAKLIEYATTTAEMRPAEHAALGNRVGPAEGAPPIAVPGYVIRDFNRLTDMPFGEVGLGPDAPPLRPPQIPRFYALPVT